ncbi:MAG: CBS domain-containing protein [Myxococcota bacterium]
MTQSDLTVQAIMSRNVETLDPSDDVDLADMVMRLDRLHHLPVVEDGQIVGLVSQRDVAAYSVSPGNGMTREDQRRANLGVKVRDMMISDVLTVDVDTTVLAAAELMREHYFGCLPVVEDGELVGIVTGSDMLRLLIEKLER